jgi:hypothetical protein
LRILAEVGRLDYDVWAERPVVTRRAKLGLLVSYLCRRWLRCA